MPKSTKEVALLEPLDTMKPLVKEFVDTEKDLIDFVTLRLPHVPRTTVCLRLIYTSKDKKRFRYRANYWASGGYSASGISTGKIVKSVCIEVSDTQDGLIYRDVTNVKP